MGGTLRSKVGKGTRGNQETRAIDNNSEVLLPCSVFGVAELQTLENAVNMTSALSNYSLCPSNNQTAGTPIITEASFVRGRMGGGEGRWRRKNGRAERGRPSSAALS